MHIRSILPLAALLLLLHCPVTAQDNILCFEHLKMEAGLSHNTVLQAMQDRRGFMWFATRDGLNRYDGHRFRVYGYDARQHATSLGNNYTVSLLEDRRGNIWVGTTGGLYIFDPDRETFTPFVQATAAGETVTGKITDLATDRNGHIWIADYGHGIFRYEPEHGSLYCYSRRKSPDILNADEVMTLCVDKDNTVWAGTLGYGIGGFNRYDPAADRFIFYKDCFVNGVNKIAESDDNNLVVGTPQAGVFTYNRATEEVRPVYSDSKAIVFVNDILVQRDKIWIGTSNGLYICHRDDGTVQKLTPNYSDRSSLSCPEITSVTEDRNGGVWIATFSGGVNYLPPTYGDFEKYHPLSNNQELKGKEVRSFAEDPDGNIWIATEHRALTKFNPATRHFTTVFDRPGRLTGNNIQTLMMDGDELWVGYIAKGLDIINIKTGEKQNHWTNDVDTTSLNDNSILSLCRDSEGNVWIGTTKGASLYSKDTRTFRSVIPRESREFINGIIEDHNHTIWLASYSNGVYNYNPRTRQWRHFRHRRGNPDSLGHDHTTGLFEDSRHDVWVLTESGGVSRYLRREDRFRTYTTDDGLPNNVVQAILEDDAGKLWISTNKGLACFDPDTETFRNHSFANGPLSDQFCRGAGLRARDGRFYFGCTEGFLRFDPRTMKTDSTESPVVLTGFQLFGREVRVGAKGSPLAHSIANTKKIKLNYKQNSFSFDFATLGYNTSAINRYTYKMEGYDEDWTYLKGEQRVTYTNLPAGRYVLRVRGACSNGEWNEPGCAVTMVIAPAPWFSGWAIALYCLLALAALYWLLRSYRKRQDRKKQRLLDELNIAKEKAVYEAKVSFFTCIAHEIKTPLSLIKAPYEMLSSGELPPEEQQENMEVMGENIDRLQVLTKQLLDISKIERKGFALNSTRTNINHLVETVLKSFSITFRQKNIRTEITLQEPAVVSQVDQELFLKIVSNLVNNATKYGRERIIVDLRTAEDRFILRVSNDGNPIPQEHAEKIFETFYQVPGNPDTGGVGIGLSLVREFVEMHGGRVYVDASVSGLTSFVVEMPLTPENPALRYEPDAEGPVPETGEFPAETEAGETPDEAAHAKPVILVVEDEKSMGAFLRKLLSKKYKVLTAENGEAALALLERKAADLVLSDVMMPRMDGFTLCREIKTRIDLSHIPVILLTAKFDLHSKIDGMEVGADAYIEKPFSPDFLIAQISNILNNKKILKEAFLRSPFTLTDTLATSAEEERFLTQVNEIIMQHLDDQSFTVDQMAAELNIGRSSLYRKIKEVTHLNPNDFIRLVRLKKAAEMMKSGGMRINEICYLTGFNSPSYFAKCFQKQFGVLPKDFIRNRTEQTGQTE